VCNYYIASSAVRYHVWSLAYSMLFGWTNTHATDTGYSNWWFSVASYSRPAMRKKWAGVLFVCQCWTYRQPSTASWTQDIIDWLTIQSRKTMLITGRMEGLDISQPGDWANISISVDRCSRRTVINMSDPHTNFYCPTNIGYWVTSTEYLITFPLSETVIARALCHVTSNWRQK